MKGPLKITAFLNLSILYCLFLSIYCGNAMSYHADFSRHNGTEFCSPIASSNLFCNTDQSDSSTSFCNKIPRTTPKNYFNQFSSCTIASELLLFSSFSRYNFFSKNLIIQFGKTDIVFPFHYFW